MTWKYCGTAMAASMPMIRTTTNSSMSVNPLRQRAATFLTVIISSIILRQHGRAQRRVGAAAGHGSGRAAVTDRITTAARARRHAAGQGNVPRGGTNVGGSSREVAEGHRRQVQ